MTVKAPKMKLKLDDAGHVVLSDGKPVYVADDGKEIAADYPGLVARISGLNGEAKGHREAKEAAEARLREFDGIEDPTAARAALETMKNLDSGKLLAAGKVDEIKAEAKRAFDEQLKGIEKKYEPVVTERDTLKGELNKEKIGGSFSRSKFIADKLAIPTDLAEARFGGAFSLEDGKVVAKDSSGNRIYSRAKPGEIADFEEALELLVDAYPHRDHILKGSGASGGGAGGSGNQPGGKRTITRAQFDAMPALQKAAAAREAAIVD